MSAGATIPLHRRILWTALASSLILIALELCCKALDIAYLARRPGAESSEEPVPFDRVQIACFAVGGCIRDPDLLWTMRPGLRAGPFILNARGLRGPEIPPEKPEGELRIVVLGGSHPFGMGVGEDEPYARVLEREFAARQPGVPGSVRVVNAAIPGFSSYQVRRLVEEDRFDLEPDLLVVDVGFNDRTELTAWWPISDAELGSLPSWEQRISRVLWASSLYWRLKGWLMNLGAGLGSEAALADRTRCSLEETAGNLAAVRRASEGRGVPVLFMTQVAVGPAPSGDDLDRLSDPVLGNVPEPSFDVLSLLAAHAGRLDELMQPDGCHATAAGHALIGQSLADWLLEHRERFLAGAPR